MAPPDVKPVVLYPYQQRWLADKSRFKAGMLSRQIGKTFTATLEIAGDCAEAEAAGRRARWVILSRGERQAKEAVEEGLKLHLQALQTAFKYTENDYSLGGSTVKAMEVILPGGSRVTALPATPDTARGFSANVLLDEFAFHADSRKIWAALFPVISAGHKLRVISTPNGKGNKFHELMTDNAPDNPWSRHVVDIHQAVAEGLPRDVDELRRGLNDADAWAQEYELQWLDEALAWLPYDLLASIEHEEAGDPEKYLDGATYIGNDIAARQGSVGRLGLGAGGRRVVDARGAGAAAGLVRRAGRHAGGTRRALPAAADRDGPDRHGRGSDGGSEAALRRVPRRGCAVHRTGEAAHGDAAQAAAPRTAGCASRWTRRSATDLHSLRRITTPAGNVRFDVDGGDGHADRAWAAALGVYAADTPLEVFDYRPVRTRYRAAAAAERQPRSCHSDGPRRRAPAGACDGRLREGGDLMADSDETIRLYGPDGRPVRKRALTREAGQPTLTGVRQVSRHESMAIGLTPRRLAAILRMAAEGDYQHDDYLTLAEEMEERDPHYAAVLGVRKRAVSGLDPAVESAIGR